MTVGSVEEVRAQKDIRLFRYFGALVEAEILVEEGLASDIADHARQVAKSVRYGSNRRGQSSSVGIEERGTVKVQVGAWELASYGIPRAVAEGTVSINMARSGMLGVNWVKRAIANRCAGKRLTSHLTVANATAVGRNARGAAKRQRLTRLIALHGANFPATNDTSLICELLPWANGELVQVAQHKGIGNILRADALVVFVVQGFLRPDTPCEI